MTTHERKFIIFIWGCQMNEDDAEQIASILTRMGFTPTDNADDADIAMLVTCSVRAKPEQKAKSKLGELRLLKEQRPDMIIGVCGCMAQKEGEKLKRDRPFIDLVIGTASIPQIPDLIQKAINQRQFFAALNLPPRGGHAADVPTRVERVGSAVKSFVPVMYGCDNFCAYCIVPHVRGKERSRSVADIVSEIRYLAQNGRREVTLLGQNVNSYTSTIGEPADFADLLRAVNEIEGIERVRFTTSHPKDLSDRLIDAIRDVPAVCEHVHLAVQSGDDDVLRRMNRKYTTAQFIERVSALRQAVPGIAITTDFLVGFPGETSEQFENTIRMAQQMRFDAAFMFAFDPIAGTAAADMPDQISRATKNQRLRQLIDIQNALTREINDAQTGSVFEVMVEGTSAKDPMCLTGLTRQNKTVNFTTPSRPGVNVARGSFVDVLTTGAHLYGFTGRLAEQVSAAGAKDSAYGR